MTERDTAPHTRSARLHRELAANAYWGINSNARCHDPESTAFVPAEPQADEDSYIVSLDLKTGELSVEPSTPE